MIHIQDPGKQVSFLQQCLSNDKRPLGLFLGAGCPLAIEVNGSGQPLIPGTEGMIKAVREQLAQDEVCSGLVRKVEQHFHHDDRTCANIEDMLSHVRGLRAVAGKDTVRGLSADDLDNLDQRVCQIVHGLTDRLLPHDHTPYHYLASWVGAIRRASAVEVFTANYDLLMEQAFEACGVPYFDGFAGARRPFFDIRAMEEDVLPPRWARLWKLHGSINWYQVSPTGVFRSCLSEEGPRRVIHPSHLKYEESRRMPYLAMMDRLRSFLKQSAATLIICGYSFRDAHINDVILQGLQSTPSAVAFGLLYDELGQYPIATDLAKRRRNLALLARDGAVISGQEAAWLEKDASSVPAESTNWVLWSPVDPTNKEDKHRAEFQLGNFAALGRFLHQLAEGGQQALENSVAE